MLPFVLAAALVTLPSTSVKVTDQATGIPVTIRIGSFAIGAYEVTQDEYQSVTGANPSLHRGPKLPVQNVSWWDAIRYCNLLSEREHLQPVYKLDGAADLTRNGYRLPTDAEWTYAAGAGPQKGNLGPVQTKNAAEIGAYAREHQPQPVGSYPPNDKGLYDMTGNVWEWLNDWNDPSGAIYSVVNPAGPPEGVAKMLRGGGYVSSTSRWSKGYRSSVSPDRRSPYTGFRVCRTVAPYPAETIAAAWAAPYQDVPAAYRGQLGPLQKPDPSAREKWLTLLGKLSCPKPPVIAVPIRTYETPLYRGRILDLQVEPDYSERIHLFLPRIASSAKLPVVIVPFYDVDTPAGVPLGGRNFTPLGTRAFAHLAVQQGFAAVAIRWFGESYGENYGEAVANLALRHPNVSGLGKWVWDSQRLLDYLETIPEIDMTRVGIIGHSLGGKMTLYATAFDPRVKVAVSSEPGIGLDFSNYDDFWYHGERLKSAPAGTNHHELLGLIAPRPFLLIGGEDSDKDKSWHFINAAKLLYPDPNRIGYLNHRSGHSPTPEATWRAMEWLRHYLLE